MFVKITGLPDTQQIKKDKPDFLQTNWIWWEENSIVSEFSVRAPRIWNDIPEEGRAAKTLNSSKTKYDDCVNSTR